MDSGFAPFGAPRNDAERFLADLGNNVSSFFERTLLLQFKRAEECQHIGCHSGARAQRANPESIRRSKETNPH
jgi:hypothetical protein